jgi:hypothetical protein
MRFPANAVVCLSERELSTIPVKRNESPRECCGSAARRICGHIIRPRGADSGQTQGAAQANLSGHGCLRTGHSHSDVRNRLRCVSPAGRCSAQSLWLGRGESFLRRTAEKWKDAVHLRPSDARDLRAGSISAFRDAALLVPQPPSGATDEYLIFFSALCWVSQQTLRLKALPPRAPRKLAENAEDRTRHRCFYCEKWDIFRIS